MLTILRKSLIIKTLFLISISGFIFFLDTYYYDYINPGGFTPQSTIIYFGEWVQGCFGGGYLIPHPIPVFEWTLFWIIAAILLTIYLHRLIPKLSNQVEMSDSRHETFNIVIDDKVE